jgi:hypothetical protein
MKEPSAYCCGQCGMLELETLEDSCSFMGSQDRGLWQTSLKKVGAGIKKMASSRVCQ